MHTLQNLLDIMAKMRGEGGCPWDREQTLETLKQVIDDMAIDAVKFDPSQK